MATEADLPYVVEYAKSSRSSCKGCKNQITKDVLRMGIMVQSPHFDGKIPMWHHLDCFFQKKSIKTTGDIAHFATLRWEDQEKIKKMMETAGINGAIASAKAGKKLKEAEDAGSTDPAANEFAVEYSKSSRASCKVCLEKIPKGVIRISKLDVESGNAARFGPIPAWHHVDCFVNVRESLEFPFSADILPGFSTLNDEDKTMLKSKLKPAGTKGTKRKSEDKEDQKKKSKTNAEEEEKLKEQNKLIYSFRDQLEKELKKKQMAELLEANVQTVPEGVTAILDLLADCMTFGSLKPCPECSGQLRCGSSGYKCKGYVTGWTKCQYSTKTPERFPFKVPDELKDEFSFLQNYKHVKRQRIFPSNVEPPSVKPSTSQHGEQPLKGVRVCIIGNLKMENKTIEERIMDLGGKTVFHKIDKTAMFIISSEEELKNREKQLKTAETNGIFILSEGFLDVISNPGVDLISAMDHYMLHSWNVNIEEKLAAASTKKKSSSKQFSAPQTVKVAVQGGAAVDPDSGLLNKCHVFKRNGELYTAVLGNVDIVKKTNSYYKIQLLESNKSSKYYVFRAWGRTGTTIGSSKIENYFNCEDAIEAFEEIYMEKTGNAWEERKHFVKYPGCFFPVEIDYGEEEVKKHEKLKPGSSTSLPRPIQDLICLIFDKQAMQDTLLEFEIDLKKMPLGKLSKSQIEKAYIVLKEVQGFIMGDKNATKILDCSNRFYTLIPHDFGMKTPPLLDNEVILKTKTEMLDSLLEIEIAYNLMKTESSNDPLDTYYKRLKTDMNVLDKESEEFKLVETYLKNTHAATHSHYKLVLQDVFKISRQGENERYQKYKDLHNKKLLWHGSRTTNFVGILSQGLRIAPPEAPMTGYMFGKGIYFADMASKSANYCFPSNKNPTGILLLCEVALGNMYERTNADYITKLPSKMHSTKGLGMTQPDPKATVMKNGVEIPLGQPVQSGDMGALLYNEYIVYDVNQVNIQYLLKVKFSFRR